MDTWEHEDHRKDSTNDYKPKSNLLLADDKKKQLKKLNISKILQ